MSTIGFICPPPLQVGGCALWLDGNDLAGNNINPSDNTAVSSWVDKSGYFYNFTQGTGANQPLFKTDVINNKSSVLFDSSNDRLTRAYTSLINQQNTTQFVVSSTNVLDNNYRSPFTTRGNNGANLYGYAFYKTPSNEPTFPNKWFYLIGSGTTTFTGNLSSTSVVSGVPTISVLGSTGGTATLYLDGVTYNSAAYDSGDGIITPTHLLGCGGDSSTQTFFWSGYIHEIIIYSRAISSLQRQYIERYLANKWGISI